MTLVTAAEHLAAVISLIFLNSFFVAAEFSILSVRQTRMSQLAQQGDIGARTVERLQESLERLLSSTQIGITLSSLALGWIGEETIGATVSQTWNYFSQAETSSSNQVHFLSVPIAFCLVAYLQIVLGELCPKALALRYPEPMARSLGPFSWSIARCFHPLIWFLNQSTQFLLRISGIRDISPPSPGRLTTEELQLIVQTQSASGLKAQERQMLSNVFEFSHLTAGDVMVPRPNVVVLSAELTLRDLLETTVQTCHGSYPIVEDSIDDIVGFVQFKMLATALLEGNIKMTGNLRPWIRPVQFVPKQMPLDELHQLMRQSQEELVIVVDEYGGTAGLLTLADLAGKILDSGDRTSPPFNRAIQQLDSFTYRVQAQQPLEEVNEQLGLSLPLSEDYNTLGGFLINLLQQVPEAGQTALYQGIEFKVVSSNGQRLNVLEISNRPEFQSDDRHQENGSRKEP